MRSTGHGAGTKGGVVPPYVLRGGGGGAAHKKRGGPLPSADFFGQGGTPLCRSRAIHAVIVGSPQETAAGFVERWGGTPLLPGCRGGGAPAKKKKGGGPSPHCVFGRK